MRYENKRIHGSEMDSQYTSPSVTRRGALGRLLLSVPAITGLAGCVRRIAKERNAAVAILDFDGTMSNVEEEGGPFTVGYIESLKLLLPHESVENLWLEAETERASRPEDFSWNYDGFKTAPSSDPYLRAQATVDLIFTKLGLYADPKERTAVKNKLFHANYGRSLTAFREGAKDFLEEMVSHMPVFIVTNSKTDKVQTKLDLLNPDGLEKIGLYGDAKKYRIDSTWNVVPESQEVEGLDRPVLLRRKLYFETLSRIAESTGVPIPDMLVLGDIYDLDLALPQHLGASTALITREGTHSYEKRISQNVVNDLNGAKDFFRISS